MQVGANRTIPLTILLPSKSGWIIWFRLQVALLKSFAVPPQRCYQTATQLLQKDLLSHMLFPRNEGSSCWLPKDLWTSQGVGGGTSHTPRDTAESWIVWKRTQGKSQAHLSMPPFTSTAIGRRAKLKLFLPQSNTEEHLFSYTKYYGTFSVVREQH